MPYIASGLKHESNSITGKLLHNAQVTYKARGPLVKKASEMLDLQIMFKKKYKKKFTHFLTHDPTLLKPQFILMHALSHTLYK